MPRENELPFKIGADPEFNLLIDKRPFCASALMKDMFQGKLTAKDMGYELPKAGEIGWDGNHNIAELRPKPAKTPKELTANLKQLIAKIAQVNPLLEMSVLCDTGIIGGHIHFGLDPAINQNTIPAKSVLDNINHKLSSFYLPIIMSEDKLNIKTRDRSGYGQLTDYRVERKGSGTSGSYTFEFRAPSAEWMTTEKIAESTLAYLSTVYNEAVNKPRNFAKYNNLIFRNQTQAKALKDLASTNFQIIMKGLTDKIKKAVRTFELYPQYKEQIEFILSTDRVNKAKEAVHYDMSLGWNLTKSKIPSKRELFSRVAVSAKSDTMDLDKVTRLIPLNFNPDTNVSEFVSALKVKIARFNWKLKNHYFFYGLKKGIKDFIVTDKDDNFLLGKEQIETKYDFDVITNTIERMNNKFPIHKTRGKVTDDDKKQHILIGIPYDLRIAYTYKPMLETVYDMEKGRLKGKAINREELLENLPRKHDEATCYGKIADIYNNENQENLELDQARIMRANQDVTEAQRELDMEQVDA